MANYRLRLNDYMSRVAVVLVSTDEHSLIFTGDEWAPLITLQLTTHSAHTTEKL